MGIRYVQLQKLIAFTVEHNCKAIVLKIVREGFCERIDSKHKLLVFVQKFVGRCFHNAEVYSTGKYCLLSRICVSSKAFLLNLVVI